MNFRLNLILHVAHVVDVILFGVSAMMVLQLDIV